MDVREQLKKIQEQIEIAKRIGACLDGQTYSVNGMPCSFSLVLDGEKVYQGVEKGIGLTQNKDFVIACHRIYTQKMDFVQALDEKNNHTEKARLKSMSKNSFKSVFEDLKDVYKVTRLDAVPIFNRMEVNETKFVNRPANMSDNDFTILKADYLTQKDKLKQELNNVQNNLRSEISRVETRLRELSEKYYRVNPEKMDASTIKLIELGSLSLQDFQNLTVDFQNNVTMLKVLHKAVSDRMESDKEFSRNGGVALQRKLRTMTDPAYYSDGLKTIVEFGERLFGDKIARETFYKTFDGIIDDAIENCSDYEIE